MSKNIEINYKGENGYETLYPKTLQENIGDAILPEVTVDTWDGAVVVASHEDKSSSNVADGGSAVLNLPSYGNWNLSSTYGTFTGAGSLNVDTVKQYSIAIEVNMPVLTVSTTIGAQVTITKDSWSFSATATDGTATFSIPEYGSWTAVANYDGRQGTGSIQISQVTGYSLNVYVPPESFALSTMSWEDISFWASAGYADHFTVGDYKSFVLNGTAGDRDVTDVTFNNTPAYATIIGINHNASVEGNNKLHFEVSGNTSNTETFGLLDMDYDRDGGGASSYMGWEESYLNETVLADIYRDCLPAEIVNVIKETDKYSLGYGGNGYPVEPVKSNLFILSVKEITGTNNSTFPEEGEHQQRYAWYANHSRVKDGYYWTRSVANRDDFYAIEDDGTVTAWSVDRAIGITFCFCV